MSRLPLELYREILCYIPDRRDICSFSLASHSLHNEAEPFLWREFTFGHGDYPRRILDHLNATPSIAKYLHSLTVGIKSQAIVDPLRAAFQSTPNLKYLAITGPYPRIPNLSLGYLIEKPIFRLHRLQSALPISSSCPRFFSTQDKLADFHWTVVTIPANFFSATDLPSLTYFNTLSYGADFLNSLLPGRNITHLWCPYRGNISESYESVRVLSSHSLDDGSDLWITFPNLRHIILYYTRQAAVLEIVKNLNHLKSASIFITPGIDSYSSSAILAKELYACNPKLESVEVMLHHYEEGGFQRWKLEKACDLTIPARPSLGLPGKDEWKQW